MVNNLQTSSVVNYKAFGLVVSFPVIVLTHSRWAHQVTWPSPGQSKNIRVLCVLACIVKLIFHILHFKIVLFLKILKN
jgi:hypothetical protein